MSMWGFEQCSKCVIRCLNTGTLVPELSNVNIRAAYHCSAALGYLCLYTLLKPNFGKFKKDK